jgi:NAD(P)-dependent dehydrogenase (short-subunit alcohol dehydrogenase family)
MTKRDEFLASLYSLEGKTAIVTGGTGVLGGAMARGLAQAGAKVAILGRRAQQAEQIVAEMTANGEIVLPVVADVMQRDQLEQARDKVMNAWGRIDILINAAGGNAPEGTVALDGSFFDLTQAGLQNVIDLNLMGTILPAQVFGQVMATQKAGYIVNISSLSVPRALTRPIAYSAAKAGIENFTRWLAVELVLKYGSGLHVNALAPGFFLAEQNRQFMVQPDGQFTPRGRSIIEHTPAKRFGEPDELVGAVVWLCSPSASFVNGIVVPIDGGFGAYSGV